MISHDICEALYALPDGGVEPRRRSVLSPIAIAILGLALMLIYALGIEDDAGAVGMILMVSGITMLLYGVLVTITRLCSEPNTPYHKGSGYMRYRERYYDRSLVVELTKAVNSNDANAINKLPTTNISGVTLAEYRTKDGSIVAYAIYEYIDFAPRLVGKVVVKR